MGFFLRTLHDNKNKDKILSLDTESFYYATNYKGRNKNYIGGGHAASS